VKSEGTDIDETFSLSAAAKEMTFDFNKRVTSSPLAHSPLELISPSKEQALKDEISPVTEEPDMRQSKFKVGASPSDFILEEQEPTDDLPIANQLHTEMRRYFRPITESAESEDLEAMLHTSHSIVMAEHAKQSAESSKLTEDVKESLDGRTSPLPTLFDPCKEADVVISSDDSSSEKFVEVDMEEIQEAMRGLEIKPSMSQSEEHNPDEEGSNDGEKIENIITEELHEVIDTETEEIANHSDQDAEEPLFEEQNFYNNQTVQQEEHNRHLSEEETLLETRIEKDLPKIDTRVSPTSSSGAEDDNDDDNGDDDDDENKDRIVKKLEQDEDISEFDHEELTAVQVLKKILPLGILSASTVFEDVESEKKLRAAYCDEDDDEKLKTQFNEDLQKGIYTEGASTDRIDETKEPVFQDQDFYENHTKYEEHKRQLSEEELTELRIERNSKKMDVSVSPTSVSESEDVEDVNNDANDKITKDVQNQDSDECEAEELMAVTITRQRLQSDSLNASSIFKETKSENADVLDDMDQIMDQEEYLKELRMDKKPMMQCSSPVASSSSDMEEEDVLDEAQSIEHQAESTIIEEDLIEQRMEKEPLKLSLSAASHTSSHDGQPTAVTADESSGTIEVDPSSKIDSDWDRMERDDHSTPKHDIRVDEPHENINVQYEADVMDSILVHCSRVSSDFQSISQAYNRQEQADYEDHSETDAATTTFANKDTEEIFIDNKKTPKEFKILDEIDQDRLEESEINDPSNKDVAADRLIESASESVHCLQSQHSEATKTQKLLDAAPSISSDDIQKTSTSSDTSAEPTMLAATYDLDLGTISRVVATYDISPDSVEKTVTAENQMKTIMTTPDDEVFETEEQDNTTETDTDILQSDKSDVRALPTADVGAFQSKHTDDVYADDAADSSDTERLSSPFELVSYEDAAGYEDYVERLQKYQSEEEKCTYQEDQFDNDGMEYIPTQQEYVEHSQTFGTGEQACDVTEGFYNVPAATEGAGSSISNECLVDVSENVDGFIVNESQLREENQELTETDNVGLAAIKESGIEKQTISEKLFYDDAALYEDYVNELKKCDLQEIKNHSDNECVDDQEFCTDKLLSESIVSFGETQNNESEEKSDYPVDQCENDEAVYMITKQECDKQFQQKVSGNLPECDPEEVAHSADDGLYNQSETENYLETSKFKEQHTDSSFEEEEPSQVVLSEQLMNKEHIETITTENEKLAEDIYIMNATHIESDEKEDIQINEMEEKLVEDNPIDDEDEKISKASSVEQLSVTDAKERQLTEMVDLVDQEEHKEDLRDAVVLHDYSSETGCMSEDINNYARQRSESLDSCDSHTSEPSQVYYVQNPEESDFPSFPSDRSADPKKCDKFEDVTAQSEQTLLTHDNSVSDNQCNQSKKDVSGYDDDEPDMLALENPDKEEIVVSHLVVDDAERNSTEPLFERPTWVSYPLDSDLDKTSPVPTDTDFTCRNGPSEVDYMPSYDDFESSSMQNRQDQNKDFQQSFSSPHSVDFVQNLEHESKHSSPENEDCEINSFANISELLPSENQYDEPESLVSSYEATEPELLALQDPEEDDVVCSHSVIEDAEESLSETTCVRPTVMSYETVSFPDNYNRPLSPTPDDSGRVENDSYVGSQLSLIVHNDCEQDDGEDSVQNPTYHEFGHSNEAKFAGDDEGVNMHHTNENLLLDFDATAVYASDNWAKKNTSSDHQYQYNDSMESESVEHSKFSDNYRATNNMVQLAVPHDGESDEISEEDVDNENYGISVNEDVQLQQNASEFVSLVLEEAQKSAHSIDPEYITVDDIRDGPDYENYDTDDVLRENTFGGENSSCAKLCETWSEAHQSTDMKTDDEYGVESDSLNSCIHIEERYSVSSKNVSESSHGFSENIQTCIQFGSEGRPMIVTNREVFKQESREDQKEYLESCEMKKNCFTDVISVDENNEMRHLQTTDKEQSLENLSEKQERKEDDLIALQEQSCTFVEDGEEITATVCNQQTDHFEKGSDFKTIESTNEATLQERLDTYHTDCSEPETSITTLKSQNRSVETFFDELDDQPHFESGNLATDEKSSNIYSRDIEEDGESGSPEDQGDSSSVDSFATVVPVEQESEEDRMRELASVSSSFHSDTQSTYPSQDQPEPYICMDVRDKEIDDSLELDESSSESEKFELLDRAELDSSIIEVGVGFESPEEEKYNMLEKDEYGDNASMLPTISEEEEKASLSGKSEKTTSSSERMEQASSCSDRMTSSPDMHMESTGMFFGSGKCFEKDDIVSVSSSLMEFEKLEHDLQDKSSSESSFGLTAYNQSDDKDNVSISSSLAEFEKLEGEIVVSNSMEFITMPINDKMSASTTALNAFSMVDGMQEHLFPLTSDVRLEEEAQKVVSMLEFGSLPIMGEMSHMQQISSVQSCTEKEDLPPTEDINEAEPLAYPQYQDIVQIIREASKSAEGSEFQTNYATKLNDDEDDKAASFQGVVDPEINLHKSSPREQGFSRRSIDAIGAELDTDSLNTEEYNSDDDAVITAERMAPVKSGSHAAQGHTTDDDSLHDSESCNKSHESDLIQQDQASSVMIMSTESFEFDPLPSTSQNQDQQLSENQVEDELEIPQRASEDQMQRSVDSLEMQHPEQQLLDIESEPAFDTQNDEQQLYQSTDSLDLDQNKEEAHDSFDKDSLHDEEQGETTVEVQPSSRYAMAQSVESGAWSQSESHTDSLISATSDTVKSTDSVLDTMRMSLDSPESDVLRGHGNDFVQDSDTTCGEGDEDVEEQVTPSHKVVSIDFNKSSSNDTSSNARPDRSFSDKSQPISVTCPPVNADYQQARFAGGYGHGFSADNHRAADSFHGGTLIHTFHASPAGSDSSNSCHSEDCYCGPDRPDPEQSLPADACGNY